MISNTPILITGAPRSGKTMIAGIMKICGVFGGNLDRMYENVRIRDTLIKPYLRIQKVDQNGLNPLPDTNQLPIQKNWKELVENELMEDGYDRGKWMFKSSKIALTWPLWQYAYPDAKYIIVRRRTGDIVSSCMNTGYLKAYEDEEGWREMVRQYEERFVDMINEGMNCKVIWPHRMVHGDYGQVYELLEWLGLGWRSEILSHIDPKFWKTRNKEKIWQE